MLYQYLHSYKLGNNLGNKGDQMLSRVPSLDFLPGKVFVGAALNSFLSFQGLTEFIT